MTMTTGLLVLVFLSALAAGSAEARDCRMPHLPGKNAVRSPPDCDLPARPADAASRPKQDDGFVDLGNGTKVRIGGRVRVDVGVRR